ncbi:MAG: hypothetical protein IT343_05025 [Candidatus Melainabacteria bacterium]|nr:hypothetical protein [Candidatus Melainabacteria bacterium]
MKLTRRSNTSRAAKASFVCLSLAVSSFSLGGSPAAAFPFFSKKHADQPEKIESGSAQTSPPVYEPGPAPPAPVSRTATPKFLPATPAFRPYNPTSTVLPAAQSARPSLAPTVSQPAAPSFENVPESPQSDLPTENSLQPNQPKTHHPPAVLERPPIPPPPAVQAPLMVSSGDPPPALAWRAVAYKLWITPQSAPPKRTKAQSAFTASSGTTMKALMKALEEAGWTTQQFNASAGHLLAVRSDVEANKTRLIFAAHPGEGGGTVVRAAVDPDSKNFDKSLLESIFSRAQDIASRNELL